MTEALSGCCKSRMAPPPPSPTLRASKEASALFAVPQPRHMFVEGCTCGTGVVGCCPCTLGLAGRSAPGPQAAQGLHGASLIFCGAGLYVGARAMSTNLRAFESTRVTQQVWREAARASAVSAARLGAAAPDEASVASLLTRLARGQNAMAHAVQKSGHERLFDFWVSGVLQSTSALVLGLATATHMGLIAGTCFLAPLGGGLLTAYAVCFSARHLWRAWATPRVLSAEARRLGGEAYAQAYAARAAARLGHDLVAGVNWGAFALGQALETAVGVGLLGALPVALATALPWFLGASALGAMVMTLQERFVPHTPLGPSLGALALSLGAKQRARLGARLTDDVAALARLNSALWSRTSSLERIQRALEAITAPHCGPRAYRVLGDSVSRRHDAADSAALRAYVEDTARAEMARLAFDGAKERRQVEEGLMRLTVLASDSEQNRGAVEMARALLDERAAALADDEARQQAYARVLELLTSQQSEAWTEARLLFLLARGQLGELVSDAMIDAHAEAFAPPVGPPRSASAALCVAEEAWPSLMDALAQTLDRDFVRIVCNPHRARATADALLLGLEVALHQTPQKTAPAALACCAS